MLIFRKHSSSDYLITNYKVMFSTLSAQQNVGRVGLTKKLALSGALTWIGAAPDDFYLLVRNPYLRLESFFRDKLRDAVAQSAAKGEWQPSHRVFFPPFDLHENMEAEVLAAALRNISFEAFLTALPSVYRHDRHLHPQAWSLRLRANKYPVGVPVRFTKIFRMERESDLAEMGRIFDLDLGLTMNQTDPVQHPIVWSSRGRAMAEKIYARDFAAFRYPRLPG